MIKDDHSCLRSRDHCDVIPSIGIQDTKASTCELFIPRFKHTNQTQACKTICQ